MLFPGADVMTLAIVLAAAFAQGAPAASTHVGAAFARAAIEDGVFVAGDRDLRYIASARVDPPDASLSGEAAMHRAVTQWNESVVCGHMVLDPAPYGYDARILDDLVDGVCIPRGADFVHPLDWPLQVPVLPLDGKRLELPHGQFVLEQWMKASNVPIRSLGFRVGAAIQVESGELTTVRELLARSEPPILPLTVVHRGKWDKGGYSVTRTALEQVYPERWPHPRVPPADSTEDPRPAVTRAEAERAMRKLATGEALEPNERWVVEGTPVEFVD